MRRSRSTLSNTIVKALVVGAGSVGQVIARHLCLAGIEVAFLARDKSVRSISNGLVLYALNTRGARSKPIHISTFDVLTQDSITEDLSWDQIYMCVPSDALKDPLLGWIQNHRAGATIIKLQPGLRDRTEYVSHFDDSQIVTGMLSLISYRAPLSEEEVAEPGTAYWFPPLLPSLFSGFEKRAHDVADTLNDGGFPARVHADVESFVGFVLAVEAPLTAGLECAGWSIRNFSRSRWLHVAHAAIKEASLIASAYLQVSPPASLSLLSPTILRLGFSLLPKRRPILLESYLRHHFTKLGVQSRQHIDDYVQTGIEYSLEVESPSTLRDGLGSNGSAA